MFYTEYLLLLCLGSTSTRAVTGPQCQIGFKAVEITPNEYNCVKDAIQEIVIRGEEDVIREEEDVLNELIMENSEDANIEHADIGVADIEVADIEDADIEDADNLSSEDDTDSDIDNELEEEIERLEVELAQLVEEENSTTSPFTSPSASTGDDVSSSYTIFPNTTTDGPGNLELNLGSDHSDDEISFGDDPSNQVEGPSNQVARPSGGDCEKITIVDPKYDLWNSHYVSEFKCYGSDYAFTDIKLMDNGGLIGRCCKINWSNES